MAKLKAKALVVNISPNKVAIYVRWSTDEQSEGTTLTIQLERCKQYILSQGWVINEDLIYIDDGYSGGSLERPAITKLRKDIENGLVDCVTMFKLDRLSRNIVDTVNLVLDEWDEICYIKSVTEPFDTTQQIGRQILTMLAGFAEWERYNIRLRTFEGKIETVEKGKSAGFKPPYGYIVGDETGTFKIVPEKAEIIRRIYREYLSGKGRLRICDDLNEDQIPSPRENGWSESTINYILSNPLYIGQLVYGKHQRNTKRGKREDEKYWNIRDDEDIMVKDLTIDVITPIITVEEFEKVQRLKKERNVFKEHKTSGRIFTSPHLFSGLLKCANCGHSFIAVKQKKGDNFAYYKCRGLHTKGRSFCQCGNIRQENLDKIIMQRIKKSCLNSGITIINVASEENNRRIKELNTVLNKIEIELSRLDKEFDNIKKKLRQDNLDVNTFNEMKLDIEKEKNTFVENQVKFSEEISELKASQISDDEIKELSTQLEHWDLLTIQDQKTILRKWVNNIEVFKVKKKKGEEEDISVNINYNIKKP